MVEELAEIVTGTNCMLLEKEYSIKFLKDRIQLSGENEDIIINAKGYFVIKPLCYDEKPTARLRRIGNFTFIEIRNPFFGLEIRADEAYAEMQKHEELQQSKAYSG